MIFNQNEEKTITETSIENLLDDGSHLILYNDDVNTFEHVIETLVQVCNHTYEQAEQCAIIVHFKGKCDVKSGSYQTLKIMCLALLNAGLSAEIE